jgi:hypothetical protein
MLSRYATIARVAGIGVLLSVSACGTGPVRAVTGAMPVYAANPALPGAGLPRSSPRQASAFSRAIAARWASATSPSPARNRPVEYRMAGVSAGVYDPGSAYGFTTFITTRRTIVVTSDSAARIEASNAAPPRFATPRDQALWQQAGRPPLGQAPGNTQTIPAGRFTFLQQGLPLTYRQAAALPADPAGLAAILRAHLRTHADPLPPASQQLTQLANLLATAPLTNPVRSAAWTVIASLPGLNICQKQPDPTRPDTIELCIDTGQTGIHVGVDARSGAIVSIAEILLRPSQLYPHVPPGTMVGTTTFLLDAH